MFRIFHKITVLWGINIDLFIKSWKINNFLIDFMEILEYNREATAR